jgi:glyoxylase-like metal-dependent hydrolase (beta-lactamase superfamily II)
MFFKQLQVGNMAVFAYLLGDEETGEALVIDPADETSQICALAQKQGLTIKTIVNTHAMWTTSGVIWI